MSNATAAAKAIALELARHALKGVILKVLAVLTVAFIILAVILVIMFVPSGSSGTASAADCGNGGTGTAPLPPSDARAGQIEIAKQIDATAIKLGLSGRASRVGIIAGYGESTLENLGYGDTAGPDSRGVFQQRPSAGYTNMNDVPYAAESFFTGPTHDRKAGLVSVNGWESLEPTIAINKVQINDNANHYAAYYDVADAIIAEAGIDVEREGTDESGNGQPSEKDTCNTNEIGEGTHQPGDDYPYSGTLESAGISPLGYYYGNCTDFVAWRLNRDAGVTASPWTWTWAKMTNGDGNANAWGGHWDAHGWARSNNPKPGDVALFTAGTYGHVAYVQAVNDDGTVTLEEYNYIVNGTPDNKYHTRNIPIGSVNSYLTPPF